jgi:membrane carboxypeptidase/penicillin-binding protein PbpC
MDNNCLYPSESLYDGTLDYGRYAPENFDDRYRGLV